MKTGPTVGLKDSTPVELEHHGCREQQIDDFPHPCYFEFSVHCSTLGMSSCDINQAFESMLKMLWLIIYSIVQEKTHIWELLSKFPLCSFLVLRIMEGVGAKVGLSCQPSNLLIVPVGSSLRAEV
ncbi:hypothetical protein NQZ68_013031 [Dissostichus eleginoides]|nr:hypothetical protein NQZ68_013031 [Dissostichus eleginoides]